MYWFRLFGIFASFAILNGMVFLSIGDIRQFAQQPKILKNNIEINKPLVIENPFNKIELNAKSVYVFDISEKNLIYAKNEEKQMPLASLSKIMTAIVGGENMPDYTIVEVKKSDLNQEGNVGIREGERWTLRDLTNFMLTVSSNGGARTIASSVGSFMNIKNYENDPEQAFINLMNAKAQEIGMTQTFFTNPSGLDANVSVSGNYGSAKDVANMLIYGLRKYPELFTYTSLPKTQIKSENYTHNIINTNKMIGEVPGIIASKTGFTDLSGGNLAIIFDIAVNHPVVAVIMNSGQDERFADMEKIVTATREFLLQ